MKRALTASVVAGTLAIATIATPTSAQAQWGRRGWGWGLGGLALGLFIGAALSRPAYAYGYDLGFEALPRLTAWSRDGVPCCER